VPDSFSAIVIRHHNAALLGYGASLLLQRQLHEEVLNSSDLACFITVQHPPVVTLGKNADSKFLLGGKEWFEQHGIEVFQTDRGGEVTAHEPGQLVMYPILRLQDFYLSPKKYVALLEDTIVELLAEYGLAATKDSAHPGVWLGPNKICAVGVRIKDRVSLHGIALNITNSLNTFKMIVPCGISERGVTSLAKELSGRTILMADVTSRLLMLLVEKLELCLKDGQMPSRVQPKRIIFKTDFNDKSSEFNCLESHRLPR
jgi:lipoyl(octanoyl) transferase